MAEISRENFYARLDTAPHAVRGFFETIVQHFERKNDVLVHHTNTNGGDLRLAIPPELLEQKRLRNFATLYWQNTKQVVFSRTYLTPDELSSFVFDMGTVPKAASEPLNSDTERGGHGAPPCFPAKLAAALPWSALSRAQYELSKWQLP